MKSRMFRTRPRPTSFLPFLLAAWLTAAFAAEPPASAPPPSPAKPRLFELPQIDKSKAEDPFKSVPPGKAPATAQAAPDGKPAAAPAQDAKASVKATPRPVLKLPELAPAQELTRQQRELMLATSGPRKSAPAKTKAAQSDHQAEVDFSHVHWGYSGLGAPENWAKLPGNALCGAGRRQSPIDIRGGIKVDLEPIRFDYRPTGFRITDNGHTIQVDVAEGNTITVLGRKWQLEQFHFHRPSEERINGKGFEMSAHLVHRDAENNLAVVALLMERGPEHPVIQTLWNHLPLDTGLSVEPPNVAIDLMKLLPERRDYYTYMGSLTTPPCSENVLWMVLKEPLPVSPEQIAIFSRLYPMNARPLQPANNRLIKESR
jgi:carbonic anhydrase